MADTDLREQLAMHFHTGADGWPDDLTQEDIRACWERMRRETPTYIQHRLDAADIALSFFAARVPVGIDGLITKLSNESRYFGHEPTRENDAEMKAAETALRAMIGAATGTRTVTDQVYAVIDAQINVHEDQESRLLLRDLKTRIEASLTPAPEATDGK